MNIDSLLSLPPEVKVVINKALKSLPPGGGI
jgi:hypothetical protein